MKTALSHDAPVSPKHRSHLGHGQSPLVRQTFVLKNLHGLHARPSALLVRTLQPFKCQASVGHDGHIVDARSILGVMSLAAGYDSSLIFTFRGEDASAAVMAVKHLFDTRFGEAYE